MIGTVAKKVTMQMIADKLNISKNSVSQALSGKDGVSEATRQLVIKTAKEMGYRYERKRSSASRATARRVGLIASEITFSLQPFFGEMFLSIEREAHRHGISLLIQSVTPSARDGLVLSPFIADRQVDGLLILSHISTAYINKVLEQGIPTVLIDHHDPLNDADAVLTNNRFGAYRAVRHLLELGHRDIGIIGNVRRSPSYQERWEGYLLAMREHGLEPPKAHQLIETAEEETAIDQALGSLDKRPSAWFCMNDGYAYYVCSSLKKLGFRIPLDVSVSGFDNSHFSQMSDPKITTTHIDRDLFARVAVEQLLRRLERPDDARLEVLLPTTLIVRESTGPWNGGN